MRNEGGWGKCGGGGKAIAARGFSSIGKGTWKTERGRLRSRAIVGEADRTGADAGEDAP